MTKIKDLIEKQKKFAEELAAEAKAYYDKIEPVEVESLFGETLATFRVPFVHPRDFNDLVERFPPGRSIIDASLWFSLDKVAMNYPGMTLVVGDEVDDLYRVRDREAVYIWPEIYKQMPPEDAQNFRMAIWALHIWEPQQRREAKKQREGDPAEGVKDLPLNELVDFITEGGDPNA